MCGIIDSGDEEEAQTFLRIIWNDEGEEGTEGKFQMSLARGEWQEML